MMRVAFAGVGLALAIAGWAAPSVADGTVDEVRRLVRERFYDAARAEAWADRHGATSIAELPAALKELQSSHTEYVPVDSPRHAVLRAVFGPDRENVRHRSIGIEVATIDGRTFVRRIAPTSDAVAFGMLRGDEIVACDGQPFDPVRSLAGREQVRLEFRRLAGEAIIERTLTVRDVSIRQEWMSTERDGARVVDQMIGTRTVRVAILPLPSGAGSEFLDLMQDLLTGPLAGADALVLDLRGGVGGCSPEYVRPFLDGVPVIASTDRDGRATRVETQWRKPLVLLVDGETRSGKEMVAFALQRLQRATVVGERTAGAVLGGQLFPLPNGALLYLATLDTLVDGERLEGRGVTPDVVVSDVLPFAVGRDPQLDRAITEAVDLVTAVPDARRR